MRRMVRKDLSLLLLATLERSGILKSGERYLQHQMDAIRHWYAIPTGAAFNIPAYTGFRN